MSYTETSNDYAFIAITLTMICTLFGLVFVGIYQSGETAVTTIKTEVVKIQTMNCDDIKNYISYQLSVDDNLDYTRIHDAATKRYKQECLGEVIPDDRDKPQQRLNVRTGYGINHGHS